MGPPEIEGPRPPWWGYAGLAVVTALTWLLVAGLLGLAVRVFRWCAGV